MEDIVVVCLCGLVVVESVWMSRKDVAQLTEIASVIYLSSPPDWYDPRGSNQAESPQQRMIGSSNPEIGGSEAALRVVYQGNDDT